MSDTPSSPNNPSEPPVFRLGLTLAGAVSAGAYSAGVLDFLREALEAWESAKQNDGKDSQGCPVPTHRVQIQAISGTSAGAMCAAMFIGGLDKELAPVRQPGPAEDEIARLNPLYSAWVSRIDILPMLTDDDLVNGAVKSILNCRILDEIASEVLNPWRTGYRLQPWIAENAEVFLCTTSLRGIPYSVSSNAPGQDAYGMSLHSGVLKYRMVNTAAGAAADGEALAPDAQAANWSSLRNAALASGAFPLALRARETLTPRVTIDSRLWEIPTQTGRERATNIASDLPANMTELRAMCVDGGAINNEPFEHVRLALSLAMCTPESAGPEIGRLERDIEKSNAATILIDPFPDAISFDRNYPTAEKTSELPAVIKALIPAVLNQLRFKADELALAAQSDVGSRYLIAPSRHGQNAGEPTLACGELGGFIGFLNKKFRHHDYILGRMNCQRFLLRYFYVAHTNPLVAPWASQFANANNCYMGRAYYGDAVNSMQEEQPKITDLNPIPVIPLMPELRSISAVLGEDCNALPWPSVYTDDDLKVLYKRLRNRLDAVFTKLIDKLKIGWVKTIGRWLMSGIAAVFRINPANMAAQKASEHIRNVLKAANLMKKS
jgi:hypothetical protein